MILGDPFRLAPKSGANLTACLAASRAFVDFYLASLTKDQNWSNTFHSSDPICPFIARRCKRHSRPDGTFALILTFNNGNIVIRSSSSKAHTTKEIIRSVSGRKPLHSKYSTCILEAAASARSESVRVSRSVVAGIWIDDFCRDRDRGGVGDRTCSRCADSPGCLVSNVTT